MTVPAWRLAASCMLCMVASATVGESAKAPDALLSPCRVEGFEETVRCGVFPVPENPAKPEGRQLEIHVVVVPATGGSPTKDPIVPLMGGPGENAISAVPAFAERFASLRKDRDILFVDQRGTGRSSPLDCKLFEESEAAQNLLDFFPLAAVERCRKKLEAKTDLTQYGYLRFADDLEHIRRVLGYGKLNLSAGSYGTRAAQVFLRAYPESVRTVYLGSVVPMDVVIPVPLAKAGQEALEKTFAACEAEAACHAAFPKVKEEFETIMARLEAGSVKVKLPGQTELVPLGRGRVGEWVRSRLYRPSSATVLPWAIHRAYEGDWQPIVDGIFAGVKGRDEEIGWGVFFGIACSGDIAFLREDEISEATAGTFVGDYRVRQQQAACRNWPKETLPADYRKPVTSRVPTLFVSGDSDPATPLWFTSRVSATFSNATTIVVERHGHTEWSLCIARINEELVLSQSIGRINNSTCPPPLLLPFEIH